MNCVAKPYFRSVLKVWFGFERTTSVAFNSRKDIEDRDPHLACILGDLTLTPWEWRVDRGSVCSKYEHGKINDGVEYTSNLGAYSWEIDVEWNGEISPRLLVGKNISISESLQKMELEGLNEDINAALFTLNYQSMQDWNSEWYGLEQVAVRATDGILKPPVQ